MRQIDIPERERSMMLQMLGLKQDQEIPKEVNEAYWRTKAVADSVSHYFTDGDLMWIIMSAGGGNRSAEPIPKTVAELFQENKIKYGHRVFCKWRGQSGREAAMLGVTASGKVQVRFIGKAEEYELNAADVSLEPEAKEPAQ
jgi:hypothetical protein